jgi:diacylglycerol kinase family enzyme
MAPTAKLDDGLIDLLLITTASTLDMMTIFRKVYDGSHTSTSTHHHRTTHTRAHTHTTHAHTTRHTHTQHARTRTHTHDTHAHAHTRRTHHTC